MHGEEREPACCSGHLVYGRKKYGMMYAGCGGCVMYGEEGRHDVCWLWCLCHVWGGGKA